MGVEHNYFTELGQTGQVADSVLSELGANRARNGFGFYTSAAPYDEAMNWERRAYEASGGAALVSDYAYDRTSQVVGNMIREAGARFFLQPDQFGAGLLAPSGMAGLTMVFDAALGDYYRKRGHDYYRQGHASNRPVILAPVNAHEYASRLARSSGLGVDNCVYFGLDNDYQPDLDNMAQTLSTLRNEGREVAFVHLMGGDTQHGIVQNVGMVSNLLREAAPNSQSRPFLTVDTVPHGFTIWAQERRDEIGFNNEGVDGLVVNPQKAGFNLGSTLAFLRDGRVLGPIAGIITEDMTASEYDCKRLRLATIGRDLITINGGPALAFFATLQEKGLDWFRKERMRVVTEARRVRSFVDGHSQFTLSPCDNSIISFTANGNPDSTWKLAQRINNSGISGMFVTYSKDLRVRSPEELALSQSQFNDQIWTDFDGIWMNISHGHTSQDIDKMLDLLDQEARAIE